MSSANALCIREPSAKLGLRLARSLKGQTLSVDIAATDRNGHRQLQAAARSIRLNP